jgi:flavin reductase (DIM6/NTAB) family NADH-FMN oxidoreductase RutF
VTLDFKPIANRPPEAASTPEFSEAMSAVASSVVLVTCRLGERPWGMTVTAFASISADPPTVLVSLRTEGTTSRAIADTREFGVSILAAEQLTVARYGSAPGAPKFLEPFVEANDELGTSPVVTGALAHIDCELVEAVRIADHTVLFGRVRTARASRGGTPLLYQSRAYRTLAGPIHHTHRPQGASDASRVDSQDRTR